MCTTCVLWSFLPLSGWLLGWARPLRRIRQVNNWFGHWISTSCSSLQIAVLLSDWLVPSSETLVNVGTAENNDWGTCFISWTSFSRIKGLILLKKKEKSSPHFMGTLWRYILGAEKSFCPLNYPVVSTEEWQMSLALISHQRWTKYLQSHRFTAAHSHWVQLFQMLLLGSFGKECESCTWHRGCASVGQVPLTLLSPFQVQK